MKNILKRFSLIAAAAAALILSSCSKEEIPGNGGEGGEGNFTVTFEGSFATKTLFSDNTICWGAGDELVFMQGATVSGTMKYIYSKSTLSRNMATIRSTCTGFNTPDDGTEAMYFSVYPASAYKARMLSGGILYPRMEIPSTQAPSDTTFDPAADILISNYIVSTEKETSFKLNYYRLLAIAKMKLKGLTASDSKVDSVKISAVASGKSVPLAGSYYMDLVNSQFSSIINSNTFDSNELKLDYTAQNVKASGDGFTAYFLCKPFSLAEGDKLSITVYTADGVYSKLVSPAAGHTLDFVADQGSVFTVDMSSAKAYNSSSITVTNLSATDNTVEFTNTLTGSDKYYAGALPLAKYWDATTSTVDEASLRADALAIINAASDPSTLLHSESGTHKVSGLLNETTYLCYAFAYDQACGILSDISYDTVTTSSHIEHPYSLAFSTDASVMTLDSYLRYVTYTNGTFATDKDALTLGFTNVGSATFTDIKYVLYKYSDFTNTYGEDQATIVSGLESYFASNGKSLGSSFCTALNSGSNRIALNSIESGTDYVVAVRAEVEGGDYVYACTSIRTATEDEDWIHITGTSAGVFTITSDLPVASGKYACISINNTRNTPSLIATYMESGGSALSDARIANINNAGQTLNYGSLTAGNFYQLIVKLITVNGDTSVRNCLILAE
ncbi:MAG: hypothetical protein K5984_02885 [Bacteroidales bacterium]|nr:hypothetical protein [Bacteroidales bacterium]